MADIAADRIDIVVVYKIDRLTRSLTDFAKLVEVFERHKVSFVSVTQQFNTTTSMGRLMFNILLSFAQFEREVTGERIRDKIAAAKRKGMWMGGVPPMGYMAQDRKLVIHDKDAEVVRRIFRRFVETRSVTDIVRELALEGITTKAIRLKTGDTRYGTPIDKKYIAKLLRNPVYVGEIRHKGAIHAGQHEPIITRQHWDGVQTILAEEPHARMGKTQTKGKTDALLRGLLYGSDGEKYHITFPAEQVRLVNLLIERVNLLSDGIDVVWREPGWRELAGELVPGTIGGELLEMEVAA
jgi:DNA invertase Pin-like site-specific DNA recombinase